MSSVTLSQQTKNFSPSNIQLSNLLLGYMRNHLQRKNNKIKAAKILSKKTITSSLLEIHKDPFKNFHLITKSFLKILH